MPVFFTFLNSRLEFGIGACRHAVAPGTQRRVHGLAYTLISKHLLRVMCKNAPRWLPSLCALPKEFFCGGCYVGLAVFPNASPELNQSLTSDDKFL